jgi:hypothetical protein
MAPQAPVSLPAMCLNARGPPKYDRRWTCGRPSCPWTSGPSGSRPPHEQPSNIALGPTTAGLLGYRYAGFDPYAATKPSFRFRPDDAIKREPRGPASASAREPERSSNRAAGRDAAKHHCEARAGAAAAARWETLHPTGLTGPCACYGARVQPSVVHWYDSNASRLSNRTTRIGTIRSFTFAELVYREPPSGTYTIRPSGRR